MLVLLKFQILLVLIQAFLICLTVDRGRWHLRGGTEKPTVSTDFNLRTAHVQDSQLLPFVLSQAGASSNVDVHLAEGDSEAGVKVLVVSSTMTTIEEVSHVIIFSLYQIVVKLMQFQLSMIGRKYPVEHRNS